MWQNLINNIVNAGKNAVKTVQSYIAPKPTQPTPKAISQNQMMQQYTFPQAQPVNVQNAVQSGGLKVTAPSSSSGQVLGTTSNSSGSSNNDSIFRNSVKSLIPKVYASEGAGVVNTAPKSTAVNSILGSLLPGANAYSNARQFLVDKGILSPEQFNFGSLAKNIVSGATGNRVGSWNTPGDLGFTEFAGINSSGKESRTLLPAVNNLKDSSSMITTPKIKTTDVLGANTTLEGTNNLRNNQISNYNNSLNTAKKESQGDPFGSVKETLAAIDADTNAKLDVLYSQYANGDMSQEEYQRRAAEEQQKASDAIYSELIASQQAEIPLINQEFDTAKANIEGQVPGQKAEAEKLKTQNKNVYGEAMRKMVANKEASMGNLRNMFGSLGTAESSAFIDKASQLERETGTNVAQSETELSNKIADIDKTVLDFENQVKNKVSELELERQKQLKTVSDNVNMSRADRAAKANEINAKMYNDLASLKQYKDQQTAGFLALKESIIANSGDLMKNAVIQDSLYNKINPVRSYNSGVNNSDGNTRTNSKSIKNANGVRQAEIDPKTGAIRYYYIDATGRKTYE